MLRLKTLPTILKISLVRSSDIEFLRKNDKLHELNCLPHLTLVFKFTAR